MSKPEDIPQDVWDEAKAIVFEPYFMEWEGIAAVAYAILAAEQRGALREREECLGALSMFPDAYHYLYEVIRNRQETDHGR